MSDEGPPVIGVAILLAIPMLFIFALAASWLL